MYSIPYVTLHVALSQGTSCVLFALALATGSRTRSLTLPLLRPPTLHHRRPHHSPGRAETTRRQLLRNTHSGHHCFNPPPPHHHYTNYHGPVSNRGNPTSGPIQHSPPLHTARSLSFPHYVTPTLYHPHAPTEPVTHRTTFEPRGPPATLPDYTADTPAYNYRHSSPPMGDLEVQAVTLSTFFTNLSPSTLSLYPSTFYILYPSPPFTSLPITLILLPPHTLHRTLYIPYPSTIISSLYSSTLTSPTSFTHHRLLSYPSPFYIPYPSLSEHTLTPLLHQTPLTHFYNLLRLTFLLPSSRWYKGLNC